MFLFLFGRHAKGPQRHALRVDVAHDVPCDPAFACGVEPLCDTQHGSVSARAALGEESLLQFRQQLPASVGVRLGVLLAMFPTRRAREIK